jgi:hypothetical protein
VKRFLDLLPQQQEYHPFQETFGYVLAAMAKTAYSLQADPGKKQIATMALVSTSLNPLSQTQKDKIQVNLSLKSLMTLKDHHTLLTLRTDLSANYT